MALTAKYCNLGLATGDNDGRDWDNAWQSIDSMFSGVAAGDIVHVKGSETLAASRTLSTSGTVTAPIYIRGCSSVENDGGYFSVTGGPDKTITINADYIVLQNLDFTGYAYNTGALIFGSGSDYCIMHRCKVSNVSSYASTTNCAAVALPTGYGRGHMLVLECSIVDSVADAKSCALRIPCGAYVVGCQIKYTGIAGIVAHGDAASSPLVLLNNVVCSDSECSGNRGISMDMQYYRNSLVSGNTIYGADYGIYLWSCPTAHMLYYINNLFSDCGYGLYNADTDTNFFVYNNAYYNSTSSNISGFGDIPHLGEIQLTADPFVDAANGDFRLNNNAGGGASCRGAGAPTDIDLDGTQDNWLDIGALQAEPSAGGVNRFLGRYNRFGVFP